MAKLLILVIFMGLYGCAQTQMVNRVNPRASLAADQAICAQEALVKYPNVVVPVKPSPAQFNTTCQSNSFGAQCTTTQVDTAQRDINKAQLAENVANSARRISRSLEAEECLKRRGWVAQRVN